MPAARRELLVEVSTVATTDDGAVGRRARVAVLSDPDASPALRERAKTQISGALAEGCRSRRRPR